MRIGICDDNKKDRDVIYEYCESFFSKNNMEHTYEFFSKGEEILKYCEEKQERIDLLFLDVEMEGISGIEVKDRVVKADQVWRIVFVSSHLDSMKDSFGTKTIGFIEKPGVQAEIEKWIRVVLEDIKENVEIQINDFVNDECTVLKLEDILYFKADGNYTRLFLTNDYSENEKYKLITKKIGELEEELKKYPMVRVHKSYMVHLLNVTDVGQYVTLQGTEEKIPVGRSFKEAVYKRYVDYAQDKVRLRIGWKK